MLFPTAIGCCWFSTGIAILMGRDYHPVYNRFPPSFIYCSNGLAATFIPYRLTPLYEFFFSFFSMLRGVAFVSSHSLWVHLHRVTILYLIKPTFPLVIYFLMVASCGIIAAYIQSRLVAWISCHVRPSVAANLRLILG